VWAGMGRGPGAALPLRTSWGGGGGAHEWEGGAHMTGWGTCEQGGSGAHTDGRGGAHINEEGCQVLV
jgi:hypothetical protein